MGNYVHQLPEEAFDWGDSKYSSTGSDLTKELVEQKYAATMDTAEDMLERLVGSGGADDGYLGQLNDIIDEYQAPTIDDFTVTIPSIAITPDSRPLPDTSGLDLDFPSFTTTAPTLSTLPTIDLSGLEPADLPEEITAAINFNPQAHDETLFTELLTRLVTDLQSGATGLDPTVEQEIWDRAIARQTVDNTRRYDEVDDLYSGSRWELPSGAYIAGMKEVSDDIARNNLDLNGKIMIEQAELAQKNSQFVITAASQLDAVLRDFVNKKNDRSLDYAKAVAVNAITIYSENIKAYMAAAEANKIYVEVQVENLKGIVEYNRGLVASFAAEAEAFGVVISGKASKNKAITDVFDSEVKGYDAETRAVSASNQTTVEEYKLKILNADNQLKTAIAEIESSLKGYEIESSLRERVAEAMANIAMQTVASSYGSVNMSAGLSHQTGVRLSESFNHSETRTDSHGRSNTLSEAHNYEEAAS